MLKKTEGHHAKSHGRNLNMNIEPHSNNWRSERPLLARSDDILGQTNIIVVHFCPSGGLEWVSNTKRLMNESVSSISHVCFGFNRSPFGHFFGLMDLAWKASLHKIDVTRVTI